MSCNRLSQVHAYHDEALSASDRIALEAHLTTCEPCRQLLAELRALSRLIDVAPLAAPAPQVMARLGRNVRIARERGLLRMTSWLTAAAAGVLVGTLWFWPDRSSTAPPGGTAQAPQAWQTLAVMPPSDDDAQDESAPEVALAMWIANDLATGDRP